VSPGSNVTNAIPIIPLPRQFQGTTLSKVADGVVSCSAGGLPPEIAINFAGLGFVRPAAVVFLSNLLWWLHHRGTKIHLRGFENYSAPLKFLDDSLFFEQHCGKKIRAEASPRSTTRPLVKIAHEQSRAWLETDLLPWLADRIGITEASLYSIKNCVAELFNNIQDHTQFDIGSIFVQHFPAEKGVTIALSDFGIGVPAKVQEKLAGITDSQAIVEAVKEGFTTKSTPRNKGIGLDYLLKTVVLGNGGYGTIYARNGIVRFQRIGTQVRPHVFKDVGFCPGTTFEICLRTDTIQELPNEKEDLEW
jgi:hypothetical protein